MMNCLLWKSVTVLSLVFSVRGQSSGDLRLVGNGLASAGRLEVYINGQWGTVCSDSFGFADAGVACRQLGFSTYTQFGTVETLGFNEVSLEFPTWLDELRCSGRESRLVDCPANRIIRVGDCSHSKDVALSCTANGDLRLLGYSDRGRLEVYYNGQWGTVCDDSFSSTDASVACRQLGFSTYTQYGTVIALGFSQVSPRNPTVIWLDELRCLGTESRLIDCPANTIGVEDCNHSEDVGLGCTETPLAVSIGIGVTIPIIIITIIVVIIILLCCISFIRRRRHLATSTAVTVTTTHNTAHPMQSMDQKPPYSNQAPPQNANVPKQVLNFSAAEAPPAYPG